MVDSLHQRPVEQLITNLQQATVTKEPGALIDRVLAELPPASSLEGLPSRWAEIQGILAGAKKSFSGQAEMVGKLEKVEGSLELLIGQLRARPSPVAQPKAATSTASLDVGKAEKVAADGARLTLDQLRPGDILLYHDTSWMPSLTHLGIMAGQALLSHNLSGGGARTVHAAIYGGDGCVYESRGGDKGVVKSDLGTRQGEWLVFRFGGDDDASQTMSQVAAYMAEHHLAMRDVVPTYGTYSKSGALGAMFSSSSLPKGGPKDPWQSGGKESYKDTAAQSFYCSQFVVQAYHEARGMLADCAGKDAPKPAIDRNSEHISPKELQASLKADDHWSYLGRLEIAKKE